MFSSLKHSPAPNGGASFDVGRDAFGNYTTRPKSAYVPQLQSVPGYFADFGNAKARSDLVFTSTDIFIISNGILLHATSNGTGSKVGATRIAKQLWYYGRTLYTSLKDQKIGIANKIAGSIFRMPVRDGIKLLRLVGPWFLLMDQARMPSKVAVVVGRQQAKIPSIYHFSHEQVDTLYAGELGDDHQRRHELTRLASFLLHYHLIGDGCSEKQSSIVRNTLANANLPVMQYSYLADLASAPTGLTPTMCFELILSVSSDLTDLHTAHLNTGLSAMVDFTNGGDSPHVSNVLDNLSLKKKPPAPPATPPTSAPGDDPPPPGAPAAHLLDKVPMDSMLKQFGEALDSDDIGFGISLPTVLPSAEGAAQAAAGVPLAFSSGDANNSANQVAYRKHYADRLAKLQMGSADMAADVSQRQITSIIKGAQQGSKAAQQAEQGLAALGCPAKKRKTILAAIAKPRQAGDSSKKAKTDKGKGKKGSSVTVLRNALRPLPRGTKIKCAKEAFGVTEDGYYYGVVLGTRRDGRLIALWDDGEEMDCRRQDVVIVTDAEYHANNAGHGFVAVSDDDESDHDSEGSDYE